MSYFCRITPTASRDIENIMDYLAKKVSLETAEHFLDQLNAKFKLLVKFPKMGRRRDELYAGLRSVPLEDYLNLLSFSVRGNRGDASAWWRSQP